MGVNIILTAIALLLMCVLGCLLACVYVVLRKYRQLQSIVSDFVLPAKPGEPSPLGLWIDNVSHTAGHAIALEVKTTLMGKASAVSRQTAAIEGDIVEDVAHAQPGMSGLLGAFPTLNKRLRRNPGLLELAAPLLAGMMGAKNGNQTTGGNVNHNGDTQLELPGFGGRHGKF